MSHDLAGYACCPKYLANGYPLSSGSAQLFQAAKPWKCLQVDSSKTWNWRKSHIQKRSILGAFCEFWNHLVLDRYTWSIVGKCGQTGLFAYVRSRFFLLLRHDSLCVLQVTSAPTVVRARSWLPYTSRPAGPSVSKSNSSHGSERARVLRSRFICIVLPSFHPS